nr:organelle RRM domain-containing protein 6, chloroplastic-like [Tanacetum cinerariifolium]
MLQSPNNLYCLTLTLDHKWSCKRTNWEDKDSLMFILNMRGLSFRTTEESLRNAFQSFGQLIEVNLVMDKIANRPRGFAFLRYATKEESDKAIEGMHGKVSR